MDSELSCAITTIGFSVSINVFLTKGSKRKNARTPTAMNLKRATSSLTKG